MEVRVEKEELVADEFSLTSHHNVVLDFLCLFVGYVGGGYYNLILQQLLEISQRPVST